MGADSGSAETVSGPSKSAGTSLMMVVEHRPSAMIAATNAAMIHPPREESHPPDGGQPRPGGGDPPPDGQT